MRELTIHNVFDDFFDGFGSFRHPRAREFRRGLWGEPTSSQIQDKGDLVLVTLEVPGFSEEEVSVEAGGDFLCVEAKNEEKELSRVFSLSGDLDYDKAKASVDKGILKIEIPKRGRRKIL